MSTRSQLTKDLNESVKSLLGKNIKILRKTLVKLEKNDKKTENRVMVFSPCRLFFLTAKVPTRIDFHFHYLEIQKIESKKSNQLVLSVSGIERTLVLYPSQISETTSMTRVDPDMAACLEVDGMLSTLASALLVIFPSVPITNIIRKIELVPEKRLEQLLTEISPAATGTFSGVGPCCGFSTQYACMCDYHGLPYRDEVAWDIDTIYLSHNSKELSLKDFEHLDQRDIVPIVSALEHNTWFTKLRAGHIRMSHEALDRILLVIRRSLSIEELYLDNLGLRGDFAHKLSLSLLANPHSHLHSLDLSNNLIEDKGVGHLSHVFGRLPTGLVKLNLSFCGLTCKGVNQLAHALLSNPNMSSTLAHLDISGNNLKEELNNLCNFLAQPNCISHLDVSGTDATLEHLFGALLRGCTTHLTHLNVSKNRFASKKGKEVPPSFKQFFTSTLNLKYLNFSGCSLPLDALKNLLLGLACNESTEGLALDLSNNNLSASGAHVIESCIHGVRCLGQLDLNENNFDVELGSVITAIGKNKSLKHLNLGRNLASMKQKHVVVVMEALVQMIQEDDCILQSLSLADSKLKTDVFSLINALGSNQCLQSIDISGNMMGDAGARLLAKALQINTKLKNLVFDRNNVTLQGYSDIAYALESNYTLRYMPFPVFDVQHCMKASAERTDIIMRRVQELIHRNVTPKRQYHSQALRLQQGFLLTSTQQMVDRLVLQTQDSITALSQVPAEDVQLIEETQGLISDAESVKQLLHRLNEVALKGDVDDGTGPVDIKLQQCAIELHTTCAGYIQRTIENMMTCAIKECPHVLADAQTQQEIARLCRAKSSMPLDFVNNCIVEQAGTEIVNKIKELNLMTAAHLSDKITDEVIECLSRSHKAIVGDSRASIRKRSSTPDVLRTRSRLSSDALKSEAGGTSPSDCSLPNSTEQSPMATPHMSSKRKSLYGRKLRPQSVVDSSEGLSADDIPDLLPKSAEESQDSVSDLPSSGSGQVLMHLVKSRPKRAKTRAPTRPMLRGSTSDTEQSSSKDSSAIAEGLDTFFVKPSPTPSNSSSLMNTPRSQSSDNLRKASPLPILKTDKSQKPPASPLLTSEAEESTSPSPVPDHAKQTTISTKSETSSPLNTNKVVNKVKESCRKPPPIAPKPRPWSMFTGDKVSGELSLVSDGGSSSTTSDANTPDSVDALDESTDSGLVIDASETEKQEAKEEVAK
ncbi:F-actin-uncapping protein LRRC16A isoform X2 [Neocloeon triangulifer]|uniref:F-actin-uncapping protein LRRC16A isoform X2 n=1 Tax=Neocloeon triangulifer TaxID=2078957 RepID=UPI00286F57AE|nr:F-actin-uncapping protein LRRC16A isoform X2 [Neocloeon triangulifer]